MEWIKPLPSHVVTAMIVSLSPKMIDHCPSPLCPLSYVLARLQARVVVSLIRNSAVELFAATGVGARVDFHLGSALEVPRACLRAEAIAAEPGIDFVSIGTDMLTQLVYGFSKVDADKFLVPLMLLIW